MNRIKSFKSFERGFYREISNSEYYLHCFDKDNRGFYHMGQRIVPLTDSERSKISMILNIQIDKFLCNVLESPSVSIEMTDKGHGYRNYENGDDLLIQVFINKNDDEYYYVKVVFVDTSSGDFELMEENFYECDQFDGLIKFLEAKFF